MKKVLLFSFLLIISSSINCMNGNILEICEAMRKEDVNGTLSAWVNKRDKLQRPLLHDAASNGNSRLARLLVQFGAIINARDNLQHTPLHLAAYSGHTDVVRLLLQTNAEVNAIAHNQLTPLHFAVMFGRPEPVRLLLQHGAHVTAKTPWKETPLHWAVINGNIQVVQLLLQYNADLNVKNYRGKTPLNLAEEENKLAIVQLLNNWPRYKHYRNRQISAFLVGQNERAGLLSPAYHNLDRHLFNHIAQLVRSEWKYDSIEQIHDIAIQERQEEEIRNRLNQRSMIKNFLKILPVIVPIATLAAVAFFRLIKNKKKSNYSGTPAGLSI